MNLATGVLFISLILSCIYISSSEKILYISTVGCKSTASLHFVLSQILINHGHEIVAVSPFPRKGISNYSDIDVHNYFYIYSDKFSINDNVVGTFTNLKLSFETQYQTCKKIYEDKKITNLIKKKKIDLVMMEVDGTDCLLPFVLQFHVPIIGVSTSGIMYADFDGLMGNPVNPSYIPTVMSGFSSKMNFIQRLFNTQNFIVHWLINFYYNRKANILIEKHLKSPPIEELYDKFSLIFYNSHFTFLPKPVAPNSIGIAGIHIQKPSPLPQEIKNFIDAADNGVIYVSLGSVVQFSGLPKQIHGAFVNAFQKLPYRVIWRHDKPEMVPNSKKFFVRYWLPQKEILAEKKIILFISHNGMFSTHEAIHNGIPILSFPVIYDQFTNAAISQNLGIAKSADLRQLNESLLIEYINEVIQDKKYRENMNRVSNTFRDRPQSPEDTFIYWVEYVLKHKNVSFLKPIGSSLPFYQYLLLDVILFITFVIYSLIWIISQLIKFSCSCTGKKRLSKVPEKLD